MELDYYHQMLNVALPVTERFDEEMTKNDKFQVNKKCRHSLRALSKISYETFVNFVNSSEHILWGSVVYLILVATTP